MDVSDILLLVLLVAASLACGFAVWAMRELAETARSARALSDDTRERLVPLLEKADVTIDAVNAELLRIDAIITQVESASARVSHASDTLSNVVTAPGEIVNDVASRVRRAWKERRRAEDDRPEGRVDAESADVDADHGDPSEETASNGANVVAPDWPDSEQGDDVASEKE